ncbi:MAG: hypothetical protein WC683_11715 [bacterium]
MKIGTLELGTVKDWREAARDGITGVVILLVVMLVTGGGKA